MRETRIVVFCDNTRQFKMFLNTYPALRVFWPNRITFAPVWHWWAGLDPLRTLGIVTGTLRTEDAQHSELRWERRAEGYGDPSGAVIFLPY